MKASRRRKATLRRIAREDATRIRQIGPIPSRTLEPTDPGDPYRHSGGPAPIWGGYRPIQAPYYGPYGMCGQWTAHTSPTRLWLRDGQWFIEAPHRKSRRVTQICMQAMQDGRTSAELVAIGAREDEIGSARAQLVVDALALLVYANMPRQLHPGAPAEDEAENAAHDAECECLRREAVRVLRGMGLIQSDEEPHPSKTLVGGIDVWGPTGSADLAHAYRRTVAA
jgi:hypothetical protein